jgi:hypothetical protein
MGDDRVSPSDVELLEIGRALSGAYGVSLRCSSCGDYGPLAMPDGVKYVVAQAFSAGYRLRELGSEGLSRWMIAGDALKTRARSPVCPPVALDQVDALPGTRPGTSSRADGSDRSEPGLSESSLVAGQGSSTLPIKS